MAKVKGNKQVKCVGQLQHLLVCTALLLLGAACSETRKTELQTEILTPEKHPETAISRNFVISGDSVGNLRIGSTSETVYEVFGKERLRKQTYEQEGMSYTAIEVYHDSLDKPSLVLMMNCNPEPCIVRNIAVRDSRYHTRNGMGIGDTFGELKRTHKTSFIGWGEDSFVAVAEDMPVTFELNTDQVAVADKTTLTSESLPDSTRIGGLFMYDPAPRKPSVSTLEQETEKKKENIPVKASKTM